STTFLYTSVTLQHSDPSPTPRSPDLKEIVFFSFSTRNCSPIRRIIKLRAQLICLFTVYFKFFPCRFHEKANELNSQFYYAPYRVDRKSTSQNSSHGSMSYACLFLNKQ